MILNGLKINQDKSTFFRIHSKFRPRPLLYHIQVSNERIPFLPLSLTLVSPLTKLGPLNNILSTSEGHRSSTSEMSPEYANA